MALVTKSFSDIITFTRASTATYFDSAGVLQSAAINTPRFDYNPATLAAQGLLIEEARTNSIRNNTMQGAVAGTPGTVPTNWSRTADGSGLTFNIAAVGTENGIAYIDVRCQGTATSAAFFDIAIFDTSTAIAATNGQTWTGSAYIKLQAGSTTGLTSSGFRFNLYQFDSGGVFLSQLSGTYVTPASTALGTQRLTQTLTTNNASTAFIRPVLSFQAVNGVAIDITLRIGLPQLEQGAFATSVIPTTTTALTRSADVASVNTLSPWYNASEGTLYAEIFLRQTGDPNSQMMASFNDTTANNRWSFSVLATTNATQALRNTGGAGLIITNTSNTATVGAVNKSALAISTGASLVLNGGTVATNASYAAPTVTRLELGQQLGAARLNGWLRRLSYYPRRLSNAELQAITA